MKKSTIIICLLLLFHCSYSQDILFQNEINVNYIQSENRIHSSYLKNYTQVKYYQQDVFDITKLQVAKINNELITILPQKNINYSNGAYSTIFISNKNTEYGSVVFSNYSNRIFGEITVDLNNRYIIQQVDNSIFAICKVAEILEQENTTTIDVVNRPINNNLLHADICNAASLSPNVPTKIDLMICFTAAAETAIGGAATMNSSIATAVTNMNVANTNSGINPNFTFNLAHTYKVTYSETGDIYADLNNLSGTTDGFMDEIHTLRNTYAADLVTLLTATPTSICGLGYLNSSATNYSSSAAFNVCIQNCMISNYSMAHELGHNMGLHHDWYVETSTQPCAHHHGYTNRSVIPSGLPTTARWRTILAYNNECAANGFNCTRINRWSNPSSNYLSQATGVAIGNPNPSNEVYGFERFFSIVAQFRTLSSLPVQFIYTTLNNDNNQWKLSWQVGNEIKIKHYEVEITNGNNSFTSVKTITTNPIANQNYNTYLQNLQSNTKIRIVAIDLDGRKTYSPIISIKNSSNKLTASIFQLDASKKQLVISNNNEEPAQLIYYNALGKIIHTNYIILKKGITIEQINLLEKGLVIIKIQTKNNNFNLKYIH